MIDYKVILNLSPRILTEKKNVQIIYVIYKWELKFLY